MFKLISVNIYKFLKVIFINFCKILEICITLIANSFLFIHRNRDFVRRICRGFPIFAEALISLSGMIYGIRVFYDEYSPLINCS
jgi:hypothetical protein